MGWEAAPRVDWSAPIMSWEPVLPAEVWPARAPTAAVRVRCPCGVWPVLRDDRPGVCGACGRWWYRRHAGWIERADGARRAPGR